MRTLWIMILLVLFTGCSRIAHPPNVMESQRPAAKYSWEERKDKLSQINHFNINGKIAVSSKRDSGSASVSWKERADQYFISLMGPLGSHNMNLSGQANQVTLQMDGKTFHAKSAEQLLASQWGYQLPVSNLKYWVRGIPVPGIPSNMQLDGENRLTSLTQQGFQITYTDYSEFNGIALPTRLSLYSNALRIKIVIYNWQIG